jgi:hypothetical protein
MEVTWHTQGLCPRMAVSQAWCSDVNSMQFGIRKDIRIRQRIIANRAANIQNFLRFKVGPTALYDLGLAAAIVVTERASEATLIEV